MQPGALVSGKYRLLRLLGAGGMGSVWAARNELTDRDFAIKFLLPALAQNKEALQRFFHEARACGQIKHPAVVDVYDMGQAEDGSPYIVMELLEGEGFDHRLARSGVLRPSEAATWIAFVARGLEEAHVRGLVHRDLKPGNIFFALDARGDVIPKVLDFGVAKAAPRDGDFVKTTTGSVVGSPAYMSPEQAKGETDVDARSDVWSLGVILYEALTGQVPFDAPNYNALMVSIIMTPHVPAVERSATIGPELSAIIDNALAKDRAERIGTARELAERLEQVAAKMTGSPLPQILSRAATNAIVVPRGATTQGPWSEEPRTVPRRRAATTAWLAAAVVLGALLLLGSIALLRPRAPIVSVAGRSGTALSTALGRLRASLDALRTEMEAAEKAKADAAGLVLNMNEIPPAPPSGAPTATAKTGAGKGAGKSRRKQDAHGGVDSAGF